MNITQPIMHGENAENLRNFEVSVSNLNLLHWRLYRVWAEMDGIAISINTLHIFAYRHMIKSVEFPGVQTNILADR